MEIPYIPKTALNKTDDSARVDLSKSRRVNVGEKAAPQTDGVSLSSKAKLMANLRAKYDKLETPAAKAADVKERLSQGTYKLNSEEIVKEILRGTMFTAV